MYLYRFETDAEFQSAYKGGEYSEPWVSCTDENNQVHYNYKPHVTIIVRGRTEEKEKTFVLQKHISVDEETGDSATCYYFSVSPEEIWGMFSDTSVAGDNKIHFWLFNHVPDGQVELEPFDDGSLTIYGDNSGTVSENIANIDNITTKCYNAGEWNTVATYNQQEQIFFIYDTRLLDGAIVYRWTQVK